MFRYSSLKSARPAGAGLILLFAVGAGFGTATARTTIRVPGDFSTIAAALDASGDGDTIVVDPGVYVEELVIDHPVILESRFATSGDPDDIAATIIDGGGGSFAIRIDQGADGAVIQGFTIRNADDGVSPRSIMTFIDNRVHDTSDGIDFEDGSGGLVARSIFEDNSDDGLDLDNAVGVVIENNIIRNNENDGIEIRLQDYQGTLLDVVIRNNQITGNGSKTPYGDGIQLIDYAVDTDRRFRIERNIIAGNFAVGIGMMADAETNEDFGGATLNEEVLIINNTIVGNDHGITGGNNTLVVNNIIADSAGVGVKRLQDTSEIVNNVFDGNGRDAVDATIGTAVFADPLLNQDHSLQAASPAIDFGVASYTFNGRDVVGLDPSDYKDTAPDAGAYEFESDDPAPTPTFTDIAGNTHAANIEAIAAAGITAGCDDAGTLYCPADRLTRAQMASFLARALGIDTAGHPATYRPGSGT